jgi:hypothetical protein
MKWAKIIVVVNMMKRKNEQISSRQHENIIKYGVVAAATCLLETWEWNLNKAKG